ncbi:MAG: Lrp/AsnC family transcriptional regulator [Pseudomonadota bacterium]
MVKAYNQSQLDQYDMKILKVVSSNGRIPVTKLAEEVGLSKTPCQVRLKRLQSEGYIRGFQAVLNYDMLGLNHVAFTKVKLSNTAEASLERFNAAVRTITEVEQCYMIAADFDYLIKVRTRDIRAFRRVLGEEISTLPNVASSSTFIAMEAVKERS